MVKLKKLGDGVLALEPHHIRWQLKTEVQKKEDAEIKKGEEPCGASPSLIFKAGD